MIKKTLIALLGISINVFANSSLEKTNALRQEIASCGNPNLTQETHPIIYNMVQELTAKGNVPTPRYITMFDAEYTRISEHGVAYRVVRDMKAYVDLLGDLYICHEVLANLSYEEIEGVIAIAIAEKAQNRAAKVALAGTGTFGLTLASVYGLNKQYNLQLGSTVMKSYNAYHCRQDRDDLFKAVAGLLILPSLITSIVLSNNLQKEIDLRAARLTDIRNVRNGIKALRKLKESYVKESVLSRIATMLNLKTIANTISYPIRSYSSEERIDYLDKELERQARMA
ncbi:MAG: hypothetical protein M1114_01765 [Candidatus Dependentiae bacterium]|nr:hypothetical protein [Candidatus Dependentiae bacterium]